MFKIVIFQENNKECVMAVPSAWEVNGILRWPPILKKSIIECLRKSGNSVPETNWRKIKCRVKLDKIKTFEEAEELEEYYSSVYSTDDEERTTITEKRDSVMDNNFNSYFNKENESVPVLPVEAISLEQINISHVQTEVAALEADSSALNNDTLPQIFVHFSEIQNEFEKLKSSQNVLKSEIDKINIKIDKILDNQNKILGSLINLEEGAILDSGDIDLAVEYGFPLDSVEKINMLEKQLYDGAFHKNIVKALSRVCGTSGSANLNRAGLTLIKYMFDDEALNNFSWRGVSGSNKLAFFQLHNIRKLLFNVLVLADKSADIVKVDSFLQNSAFKHCGQRIKRKLKATEPAATNSDKDALQQNQITAESHGDDPNSGFLNEECH